MLIAKATLRAGLLVGAACSIVDCAAAQLQDPNFTQYHLAVQVVDIHTGEPVANAPVQVVGTGQLASTGPDGWANFPGVTGTLDSIQKVWTTPESHAPIAHEYTVNDTTTVVELAVPSSSTYATGTIDPAVGGTWDFSGFMPLLYMENSALATPDYFSMQLTVPPGALSKPASINVTPYPMMSAYAFNPGLGGTDYVMGMVHITMTDQRGARVTEQLNAPVTIAIRPFNWNADTAILEELFDLSAAKFEMYDYIANQWDSPPAGSASVSWDSASGNFVFQTDHFSCGKVSVDEDIWEYKSPIPQTPPQPDPPMPKLTSEIKSVDCTVLHPGFEIYCGKANGGDLSYTNSETDKSHIIANIQAELSQTFGIDSGKVYEMVLGKMAAELNLKYSAGLAGGGEWTNASSRTLSVDHGDEYRRCAFGSMQVIQLNVEVEFKLDGVSMGTVTKEDGLMLCAKDPWVFDPTCPGCEIEIPIRPYTPMPSSCAD